MVPLLSLIVRRLSLEEGWKRDPLHDHAPENRGQGDRFQKYAFRLCVDAPMSRDQPYGIRRTDALMHYSGHSGCAYEA